MSPLSTSLKAHCQLLRLYTPSSLPFSLSGPLSQEYFLWLSLAIFSAFIQLAKIPSNDMAVLSRLVLALDLAPSLNHPLTWHLFLIFQQIWLFDELVISRVSHFQFKHHSHLHNPFYLIDWISDWLLIDLSLKKKSDVFCHLFFFCHFFFLPFFFADVSRSHSSSNRHPDIHN